MQPLCARSGHKNALIFLSTLDLQRPDPSPICYMGLPSPKLRALLPNVHDEVSEHHEKNVVWTLNPAQHFPGVDVRVFSHSVIYIATNSMFIRYLTTHWCTTTAILDKVG